jgi:hypothetical protein
MIGYHSEKLTVEVLKIEGIVRASGRGGKDSISPMRNCRTSFLQLCFDYPKLGQSGEQWDESAQFYQFQ